jgi:hypothetical protein
MRMHLLLTLCYLLVKVLRSYQEIILRFDEVGTY